MGGFFHHWIGLDWMGNFRHWMVIENDLHSFDANSKGTSPLDGWMGDQNFHLHPLFDGTRSLSNSFI
jgi:hypothetical protein